MQLMGILEWKLQNSNKNIPVTVIQRISILSCISFSAVNSFHFCIFEAKETYEFIETLYFALGFSLFVILYTIALWQRDQFIHFFGTIEETIQNRKFLLENSPFGPGLKKEHRQLNHLKVDEKILKDNEFCTQKKLKNLCVPGATSQTDQN